MSYWVTILNIIGTPKHMATGSLRCPPPPPPPPGLEHPSHYADSSAPTVIAVFLAQSGDGDLSRKEGRDCGAGLRKEGWKG